MNMEKHMAMDKEVLDTLAETLPPLFTRAYLEENSGGMFTKQTLSFYARDPRWPQPRYLGRRVIIKREEFINFLEAYYGGMLAEREGHYIRLRKGTGAETGTGEESSGAEGRA